MKRNLPFILLLAVLSIISGVMMSEQTWIGRMGISVFHKEYTFLKTWWEGALSVFATLLVLFGIQALAHNKARAGMARLVHVVALLLAFGGLYLTYHDMRHNWQHRWMGERFHIGMYLFWIGWVLVSLLFLFRRPTDSNNNPPSVQ